MKVKAIDIKPTLDAPPIKKAGAPACPEMAWNCDEMSDEWYYRQLRAYAEAVGVYHFATACCSRPEIKRQVFIDLGWQDEEIEVNP